MFIRYSTRFLKIITAIICLLAILLASPIGAKVVVFAANQLPLLALKHNSGSILHGAKFKQVKVILPSLTITVDDVLIKLNIPCLLKAKLCIDTVDGEAFQLALVSSQDEKNKSVKNKNTLINIPLSIDLALVNFKKVNVRVNDLYVEVDHFSAGAYIAHELIQIKQPKGKAVLVKTVKEAQAQFKSDTSYPKNLKTKNDWPLSHLPTISIPLDLQIEQLAVQALALDIGSFKQHFNAINLTGSWRLTKVNIDHLAAKHKQYGSTELNADAHLIHPYPLRMAVNSAFDQSKKLNLLNKTQHQIKLQGDISALHATISSTGNIMGKAKLTLNAEQASLPYSFNADVTKLPAIKQMAPYIQASQFTLKSEGDIHKQSINTGIRFNGYGYQQAHIELSAQHSSVKTSPQENASHKLIINTLNLSEAASHSQLAINGMLSYQQQFSWDLNVNAENLALLKITPALDGYIKGELRSSGYLKPSQDKTGIEQWQIALNNSDLSGQLAQQDFSLNGDLTVKSSALISELAEEKTGNKTIRKSNYFTKLGIAVSHADLTLNAFNSELQLTGYSDKNWHLAGQLICSDLSLLSRELSGNQHFSFNISESIEHPLIHLTGKTSQLRFNDISAEKVDLNLEYQPFNNHLTTLNLSSNNLIVNNSRIDTLTLTTAGDIFKQSTSLLSKGELGAKIKIDSQWLSNKEQITAQITQSQLSFKAYEVQSNKTIGLAYSLTEHMTKIESHCWQGDLIHACLIDDAYLGKTGSIKVNLDAKIQNILTEFSTGISNDSQLIGNIHASWTENQRPQAKANLTLSSGQLTLDRNNNTMMSWHEGAINIALADDKVVSRFILKQKGNTPLIDFTQELSLLPDKKIKGSLLIHQIDLSPLQLFVPEMESLHAELSSQLTLEGSLFKPVVMGAVSIDNGNAAFVRSTNTLNNFNLKTVIDESNAAITANFLIDDTPAELTASIDWLHELTMSAQLSTQEIALSAPPNLEAQIKPTLSAHFQDNLLTLDGKVHILEGLLHIDELPEGSISEGDDTIIVDEKGEKVDKKEQLVIESNVEILIDERFRLEGYGFRGNLGGGLKIQQAKHEPLKIFGTLKVNNGTYKAYSQHLKVEHGKVIFSGPPKNPHIDIKASRHIKSDDVKVGISLSGMANAIELNLYSEPSMDQPETLSYLIRGSGLDSSSGNAAAIGIALSATLSRASNFTNFVENLPLLTNISIDTEVDGDQAQATISGYIGERIYLKYGIGIYDPVDEITVRFYLLNQLWLETVSGLEKSADIYYSFDID